MPMIQVKHNEKLLKEISTLQTEPDSQGDKMLYFVINSQSRSCSI